MSVVDRDIDKGEEKVFKRDDLIRYFYYVGDLFVLDLFNLCKCFDFCLEFFIYEMGGILCKLKEQGY